MFKYLRFTALIFMKLIGKIIGVPIFYLLLPFRGYARNRIYNYVLQNNVHLPRLFERDWQLDDETKCYYPHNKSYKNFSLKDKAYIKYKKISKLEYYFALSIWVWFDDDSNFDTHDGKTTEETILKPFGTTWDLGDLRSVYPIVDFKKTFYWIVRNTFYNFGYMFEEIAEDNPNNFYVSFWIFGTYIHFGYIPYSNSERQGRAVYFFEDTDRTDTSIKEKYA